MNPRQKKKFFIFALNFSILMLLQVAIYGDIGTADAGIPYFNKWSGSINYMIQIATAGSSHQDSGSSGKEGNILFLERFNNDLSAWNLVDAGGTVNIVIKDFSTKMCLKNTKEKNFVSATIKQFTEPKKKWILEYDEKIADDGDICTMEMLDGKENVIASVNHGSKNNTVSFSTDKGDPSSLSWSNNIYKQVVLVVDKEKETIACYISEDNNTYGSLQIVGGAKPYSGLTISAVRFKTGSDSAEVYIDEVKIYTPNIFIIGDSISDGKPIWSTHPEFPKRLNQIQDETSSPSYQISRRFDNEWVANRGFGGTTLSGVDSRIQSVVLAHGAKKVIILVGHNDIYPGIRSLAPLQQTMNSIIGKMEKAGITGKNVILCGVSPSGMIDTPEKREIRESYNSWLLNRAKEIGAAFADIPAVVKDGGNPNKINSEYDAGDGVHFNKAGSGVIADTIYKAIIGKE